MMHKRWIAFVAFAAATAVLPMPTFAQSYKEYDTGKATYIEGRIVAVRWVEPTIQIDIMVTPSSAVPRELATMDAPKNPEVKTIGALAVEPTDVGRKQDVWILTMPLARAQSVGMSRDTVPAGRKIAAIGYSSCQIAQRGFRPDYMIVDNKAYLMRTTPLPKSQCPK